MNPLSLSDWIVLKHEHADGASRFVAEYTRLPVSCRRCGVLNPSLYRHEIKEQLFMDTPMHGKRVGILFLRKRFKCRDCGKTFFELPPDLDEEHLMTRRLVEYIERQSLRKPFVHVADEIGIDEKTVRNIFRAHIARLDKDAKVVTPEWLGIDELMLDGRHRAIFTDVKNRRMIGLEASRNKPVVVAFLRSLDRKKVELVTIDMWTAYREAARANLPNAEIVVDKFHVIRYANDAVEIVSRALKAEQSDSRRKGLKRDRYVLLRRPKDLDDREQLMLELWLQAYPTLKQAYDLKEAFYKVYEAKDRQTALQAYDTWQATIPADLASAFGDLTSAATNWRQEIFAYFDHPVTNAYTEALNGMIKVTNRLGRGYSYEVIRAKMLYEGGLHMSDRPIYRESWKKPSLPEFVPPLVEMPEGTEHLAYLYECVLYDPEKETNPAFKKALEEFISTLNAFVPNSGISPDSTY